MSSAPPDNDWSEFAATEAAVMDLEIDTDWMPAVIANLKATAAHARRVLDFPLDDQTEPAPVFEA